jgi:adenylosuccinate lyase
MTEAELRAMLDAGRFTGRAAEQVEAFLVREVAGALKGHGVAEAAEVRV